MQLYRNKRSDEGFVLVTALMMLVILTMLGMATIMTSTVELKIAGNDRLHKKTFYQADAGTETGSVLTYENALCINSGGFTEDGTSGKTDIGFFKVLNLDFAEPEQGTTALPDGANSDAVFYTVSGDITAPHTDYTVYGVAENTAGSGLQMISGYRGLGGGSAAGGTHILYAVNSHGLGPRNTRSTVTLDWRISTHLINNASSFDCKY
jgi:Tfp pilus assembly protein PilX